MRNAAGRTVILSAIVASSACLDQAKPPVKEPQQDLPAIAVLPFDHLSSESGDSSLADGLHEEVVTHLARSPELRVISRSSVLRYLDQEPSLADIASDLGVKYVLQGAVRVVAGRMRISVQLIDAQQEQHLWTETYDREVSADQVFDVQKELGEKIAESMGFLVGSPRSEKGR